MNRCTTEWINIGIVDDHVAECSSTEICCETLAAISDGSHRHRFRTSNQTHVGILNPRIIQLTNFDIDNSERGSKTDPSNFGGGNIQSPLSLDRKSTRLNSSHT